MPRPQRNTSPAQKPREGAREMYVTYDLRRLTDNTLTPRVKRVHVPGALLGSRIGEFKNRLGRRVHGVKIHYEQRREGYTRASGTKVEPTKMTFTKVVEVPSRAQNIAFREDLPEEYRDALQSLH